MMTPHTRVRVYTDDYVLSIEHNSPLSVEDICKECLLQLRIDFSYIHLFGLFHISKELWLSPNHLLAPSSDLENNAKYMFRIRFHPKVSIKNEKFLSYLHLHYRYCYTEEFLVDKIDTSILFGLGIVDMIIVSFEKKNNSSSRMFQGNDYQKFFSKGLLNKYNYIEKLLLKWNLKKRCRQKYEELDKNCRISNLKISYIDSIKKHFYTQINKEKYKYKNKNQETMEVIVEEKDSQFMISFKDESYCLASLRLVKIQNDFVDIHLKDTSSRMLKMEPEIAESFVSSLDALFRLAYNYHYGICDGVFSPRIKTLQTLGCYDHISDEVVANILKKNDQKGSYLMRMRPNTMDVFDVFTINSENTKVQKFTVGSNEDYQYESIESLLNAQEFLQHKIKPSHFERCDLLLCSMPVKPSILSSINSQLDKNNLVYQSSEVSFPEKNPIHEGIFTEMYKAKLVNCKMLVSIKLLRKFPDYSQFTQVFMKEIDSMLQLNECHLFLQIKGIILQPNFGLVTELPLHSAAFHLSNKGLSLKCILKMALTVAEGLEFLKKQGIVHGDINCENLQMCDQETVKIMGPSIVSKAYLLPKDNIIYQSRLPWLDPWLQKNSSQPTFESDIFSYGTMLCEMLCFHQKPPKPNPNKEQDVVPCRLLFDVSENQDMAKNIQKKVHDLISQCRSNRDNRPQPQDISLRLTDLIHEVIILPTRFDANRICDHEWKRPCIDLFKISEAIKIIQKKSHALKVPKSLPDYMIDTKFIKRQHEIGKGAFGKVYLAKYMPSQRLVAVKTFGENIESELSEVKILQQLKHARIVDFIGICNDMEIVMEYVSGGDLHTSLLYHKPNLIPFLIKILYEIAEGMEYLQKNVVIHRDLAARNILLTEDKHVKITDFGLSKKIDVGDIYKIKSKRSMPLYWSAPENDIISSKSDVWSFGVVMWECYSMGDRPVLDPSYGPLVHIKALKSGKRLPKPRECSQTKYKIMQDCWDLLPNLRPDFTELKEKFLYL